MNLLITGGCGFIGSHLVRYWRRRHPGDRVVVLDALTYAGNLRNLAPLARDPGVRLVVADLCDAGACDRVFAEESIDAVMHLAAESHVDRSIADPLAFARTNVLGTATLLEAARRARVGRFLHVSTDEVYGSLEPEDPPFTEDTPVRPRSPYAASKAASDLLVLASAHTYGFPATVTRCSNNYGPMQFPEKLVPRMVLCALADQELPVYGDGMNVRDWIHVEDHCAGLDAALRRGVPGRTYNFGGSCELRNLQLVLRVLGELGKPESLIRFVADRPGHDVRYAVCAERSLRELGWQPRIPLDRGLAETVAWYRDNPAWCEEVQTGAYRSLRWEDLPGSD